MFLFQPVRDDRHVIAGPQMKNNSNNSLAAQFDPAVTVLFFFFLAKKAIGNIQEN